MNIQTMENMAMAMQGAAGVSVQKPSSIRVSECVATANADLVTHIRG